MAGCKTGRRRLGGGGAAVSAGSRQAAAQPRAEPELSPPRAPRHGCRGRAAATCSLRVSPRPAPGSSGRPAGHGRPAMASERNALAAAAWWQFPSTVGSGWGMSGVWSSGRASGHPCRVGARGKGRHRNLGNVNRGAAEGGTMAACARRSRLRLPARGAGHGRVGAVLWAHSAVEHAVPSGTALTHCGSALLSVAWHSLVKPIPA